MREASWLPIRRTTHASIQISRTDLLNMSLNKMLPPSSPPLGLEIINLLRTHAVLAHNIAHVIQESKQQPIAHQGGNVFDHDIRDDTSDMVRDKSLPDNYCVYFILVEYIFDIAFKSGPGTGISPAQMLQRSFSYMCILGSGGIYNSFGKCLQCQAEVVGSERVLIVENE